MNLFFGNKTDFVYSLFELNLETVDYMRISVEGECNSIIPSSKDFTAQKNKSCTFYHDGHLPTQIEPRQQVNARLDIECIKVRNIFILFQYNTFI